MKKLVNIFLVAVTLFAVFSCKPTRHVSVKADFTTDKEVYELYEDIVVTNVSAATNDIIVACKWEWGSEHVYGKQLENPISFDSVGEKEIKLTVTTDSGAQDVCVKTVTVQDNNIRPVADFEWTPAEGIVAGDEVQFTDKSTDADGTIVAWEWKFGSDIVTGQNPKYTFNEYGDIEVVLTVTDNQRGKGSVKKTVHVGKSPNSMELLWSTSYDSDGDVVFSSPAVSPDGQTVYVFSTAWHLVAIGSDGEQKWSFDASTHNPGTTKTGWPCCGPSVDSDGNIYIIAGNKDTQDKTGATKTTIYGVKPDGSQKWAYDYSYGYFINVIPMVLQDQLYMATKRNPSAGDAPELWPDGKADNGLLLNKADGSYFGFVKVKRGSHGGVAATKEETILTHTDSKYGTRVFWKEAGNWKHYGTDAGQDKFMLGYTGVTNTEIGFTSYMAIDGNDKVYILYGTATGSSSSEAPAKLYCYDLTKYEKTGDGASAAAEWNLELEGKNMMYYSLGTVIGEDGTIYVTTSAGVTAVNPDGTKKWFSAAQNAVYGSPAVDKNGYVYYTETTVTLDSGKLVKLNNEGVKVAELTLGQSACTSPTIAPDGTIYVNGMKDGKPTLSAIEGVTGPATGWSQLGGNPRKSCKAE